MLESSEDGPKPRQMAERSPKLLTQEWLKKNVEQDSVALSKSVLALSHLAHHFLFPYIKIPFHFKSCQILASPVSWHLLGMFRAAVHCWSSRVLSNSSSPIASALEQRKLYRKFVVTSTVTFQSLRIYWLCGMSHGFNFICC